jgi:hypothetical protein
MMHLPKITSSRDDYVILSLIRKTAMARKEYSKCEVVTVMARVPTLHRPPY